MLAAAALTAQASAGPNDAGGESSPPASQSSQLPPAPKPAPIPTDDPSPSPDSTATTPSALGQPSLAPDVEDGTWTLAFNDDFSGDTIDLSKWTRAFPWGSTTRTTPNLTYRPGNVIVSDGSLALRALDVPYENRPFTSGIVSSAGNFDFTYGYVEMRAKLPAGQGLWPAFWLLPASGAWPPEIDVMENLGSSPNIQRMHYHYVDGARRHRDDGDTWTGPDFSADFHTFSVDWSPSAIRWYVDGVERRAAYRDASTIANEPMYLVANLQIGGSWPGDPDRSTPFPADYQIDYVRVYQSPSHVAMAATAP
jgi:beta-glucanase (GH16 family)